MRASLLDLSGREKATVKLIEAMRGCVGTLYEPTHVRRMAQAEADARRTLAQADKEIALLAHAPDRNEIVERTVRRIGHQEVRRQQNIDAIVDQAISALPDNANDEPVDQDWLAACLDKCKDVSDVQVRELWARLLAGEVGRPGRFSRSTLAVLETLGPTDAAKFTHLCRYMWHDVAASYVPIDGSDREYPASDIGLSFAEYLSLASLGLVQPGTTIRMTFRKGSTRVWHGEQEYLLGYGSETRGFAVLAVTRAGRELWHVAEAVVESAYSQRAIEIIQQSGCRVTCRIPRVFGRDAYCKYQREPT